MELKKVFSILLICGVCFLVYSNSLKGGFLWDDHILIEENDFIKQDANLLKVFTYPLSPGFYKFYRPLVSLSLMLDYRIWRLNILGYHLTSVLLHMLNAVWVYLLAFLLTDDRRIALGSGLIFSVHTLLSEPVNYMSSRADLLLAFFFLLSIVFFTKSRSANNRLYYFSALLSFCFALLSKEMAIILPIVLFVYELMFKRFKESKYNSVLACIPFAIIGIFYVVLRLMLLRFSYSALFVPENTIASLPFTQRFLTSIKTLLVIYRLLILPVGLHKEWLILPIKSIFEFQVIISFVVLFVFLLLAKRVYKYSIPLSFSIICFFLLYLPFLNIYPINAFLSENWLYLPCVAFVLFLNIIFVKLIRPNSRVRLIVFYIFLISCVSYYGLLTFNRNKVWAADPVVFYKDVLQYNPSSDRIHNILGNVYFEREEFDKAFVEYKESLRLNSKNPKVYYNLGNLYCKKGDFDQAIIEFETAVQIAPHYTEAHNNLGLVYSVVNNTSRAEQEYRKAIECSPDYYQAHYNLGRLLAMQGKWDPAIMHIEKAIVLNPYYVQAYNDLGSIYFQQRKLDQAISEYRKAIGLNPEYAESYYNLGMIYYMQERFDDSRVNLNAALSLFNLQQREELSKQIKILLDRLP